MKFASIPGNAAYQSFPRRSLLGESRTGLNKGKVVACNDRISRDDEIRGTVVGRIMEPRSPRSTRPESRSRNHYLRCGGTGHMREGERLCLRVR